MTAVWDRSKQTGTALLILLALADFTNDDGYCWPSIDTLAHKARCSRRHVQRLLKDISHGEGKEVEIRENAGPNGVHLYRILLPVVPRRPLDATTAERGDILSPGVTSEASEGDILAGGGDIQSPQMSPEPSLTINGIQEEPSEGETTAAADSLPRRSKTERRGKDHQVLAIMSGLGIAHGQARKLSPQFTPAEAMALADAARRAEPSDLGAYAAQLFRDHIVEP